METGLEKTSVIESCQPGLSATVPRAFQFNVALRPQKPLGLLWTGSPGAAASTFTQLLSSEKRAAAQLKGCPTSRGAVQARLRQSSHRQGMKHAANIDFRPTLLGVVKGKKGVAAVYWG